MKKNRYWNHLALGYLSMWNKNQSRVILGTIECDLIRKYVDMYGHPTPKSYVDLGCGPGRIIACIGVHAGSRVSIIGVDNNTKMVKLCKRRFARDSRVNIIRGDIKKISPSIATQVDVVTCIRVLKYIKDRRSIFIEIAKILMPGGVFIFTITNKQSVAFFDTLAIRHYRDTLSQIREQLKQSNFRILHAVGVQRFPEIIYSFASFMGFAKNLYVFDAWLGRILGSTTFAKTIYIAAKKYE